MIAFARPPCRDGMGLIGQLLTVYESAEAGQQLHFTGQLVGIDTEPNGETYWLLVDPAGHRYSIPWSDIVRIEYHGDTLCQRTHSI